MHRLAPRATIRGEPTRIVREGYERGLRKSGREQGLRRGIESLCRALRIELTDDRQRELTELDMAGLEAQLARLEAGGRWE